MANTAYGVNHPLSVKLWSKKLMRETLKETYVSRFMGRTKDSLIYVKDDLAKSAGDRIRVGLRMQLTGQGVQGDGTLEGQEEALATFTDDLFIDQIRWAVRSDGEMSEQRVAFSVREEALDGLRDWWADKIDTAFFNHIAGNTTVTNTVNSGNNTTVAPSTDAGNTRIIFGPSDETEKSTTENSLSVDSLSANFSLTMLDNALEQAKVATPLIPPLRINGERKYVAFLHPFQVYDLRTLADAARVTWYDTQKARVQGGEMNNPIFNGALGEYNGVIMHESTRIPLAPSTTTVRRAVFCGAQSACFGVGRRDAPNRMKWVEELFDYENQLGVSAALIWGLKKMQFNSIDFGTIVMSSHAETHN